MLKDSLGESRVDYPMTAYLIAGTQAEAGRQNFIMLMKMSDMHSTHKEEEDEDSEREGEREGRREGGEREGREGGEREGREGGEREGRS